MNKKRWEEFKERLPETHKWYSKSAKRIKERGRAKGGMVIGIRKDWGKEEWEIIETGLEGMCHVRIKEERKTLNVVSVYNVENGKEKEMGEVIKKVTEEYERKCIIVAEDFNIRIGELGREKEE